jgi:hypothetical protein
MTRTTPTAGRKRRRSTFQNPAPATSGATPEARQPGPRGKIGRLIDLLRRPDGATLPDLMDATGWQAHSVRGAIAGAVKKKLGLRVVAQKSDAGRVYRIEATDDVAGG